MLLARTAEKGFAYGYQRQRRIDPKMFPSHFLVHTANTIINC
ncbi:MAG: hypothetical protein ACI9N9_002664 [Enterobacterales bacterium]|jgi:hypothetical protein